MVKIIMQAPSAWQVGVLVGMDRNIHNSPKVRLLTGAAAEQMHQGSQLHSSQLLYLLQEWADYLLPGSLSKPGISESVSAPLTSIAGQVDPMIPVI